MKERLFCLDLLRGLDMFYLVCVAYVLRHLFNALGCPGAAAFCASHPWGGLNLYDLVMPCFIFMCGAAIPIAMRRRLSPEGGYTRAFFKHLVCRVALLWVLGMFAQGHLQSWNIHKINPFHNTLHAIAIGYAVTSLLLPITNKWFWRIFPFALCAIYTTLLACFGDYTPDGNFAQTVDRFMYPFVTAKDFTGWKTVYTWWLTSLMFVAMTAFGRQATDILLNRADTPWRKAGMLGGYGLALLVTGRVLGIWEPCLKQLFTSSFTLQAMGWSMMALAALYVVTDIWRYRRGTWLFIQFGQSALAAYAIGNIFRSSTSHLTNQLVGGIPDWFPKAWQHVVWEPMVSATIIILLLLWRRATSKTQNIQPQNMESPK